MQLLIYYYIKIVLFILKFILSYFYFVSMPTIIIKNYKKTVFKIKYKL